MIRVEAACTNALKTATKYFRLGMEAQGSENLVKFIDGFLPTLGKQPPDQIGQLALLLNDITAAQSRKDYLRVADLLEYELLPKMNTA